MTVTDEELSAFLDGELPPGDERRVAAALEKDGGLRRRLQSMGATDALLARAIAGEDEGNYRTATAQETAAPYWRGWADPASPRRSPAAARILFLAAALALAIGAAALIAGLP